MRARIAFGLFAGVALTVIILVFAGSKKNTWTDSSPHKEYTIEANGIHLDYLDWGGEGPTILFLAGLGCTPHIFDDIAPQFTNHFHVLGLTRRGFGKSDKPGTGYDTDTLVQDIYSFLEKLNIKQVILVGHSISGDELTRFAGRFPEHVVKLVYLDAAYDHVHSQSLYSNAPPVDLGLDFRSLSAYIKTFKKHFLVWSPAYEADARNEYITANDGHSVVCVTPGSIFNAILNGTCELDYLKVNAPALAFFALDDPDRQRLFAKADETEQRREQVFEKSLDNFKQAQIKRFRLEVKNSRIIEMPNTSHFCFIQRQDEVVRQMRAFLEATPTNDAQIIQNTNTHMN